MAHYKYLIFLVYFAGFLFPQKFPDPEIDKELTEGVSLILNQKYAEAEDIFDRLDRAYPFNPLGKIYLSAVEIARSVDYGEPFNNSRITYLLEEAESLSDSLLDSDGENVWYKYYTALTSGYLAYYYALNENYLVAFSEGLKSIKKFNECLESDGSFYDAYIAIGTYRYWKSKKTDVLNFLPFYDDDTGNAIGLLKKAIDNNTYNNHLAINSLIWIYIEEGKSREAIRLAKEELKKFPESRFFKWGLARAYEDVDKEEAILTYQDILNSHLSRSGSNGYNEIILRHKIAMLLHKLGKNDAALENCRVILNTEINSEYVRTRLEDRLKRVKELWDEMLSSN